MREMIRHRAGRIYLFVLVLSIIGYIVFLAMGGTTAAENGEPILVFGWMTMSLVSGVIFVGFWLVTYIIYFFLFWPYR
jgi:TRAP-type C4-dicarboxylate transport system permease small subunit